MNATPRRGFARSPRRQLRIRADRIRAVRAPPEHARGTGDLLRRDPVVRAGGGHGHRRDEQLHARAPRPSRRRGLVGPVRRAHAARALLAEQELHLHRGGDGDRGGEAQRRRRGAEVLPGRGAGAAVGQSPRDARARPAAHEHGTRHGAAAVRPGGLVDAERDVGEAVLRASGDVQAGHALPVQQPGDVHAVGDRAEGHRANGARLSAAAAVRRRWTSRVRRG